MLLSRSFKRPRPRISRKPDFLIRFIIFVLCCILVILSILFVERRFTPIIESLAIARVEYLGSKIIYDSINEVLSEQAFSYNDLVYFVKDDKQRINALQTNIVKINQLKSKISMLALDRLNQVDTSEIYIPLGNVINGEFLSGRGPKIPIKLIPYGSITVQVENVFTQAGINQTRHQIMMVVTANLSVILPNNKIATTVKAQVNIAETLIVGDVPNAYTNVTGDTNSTIGKINDYKQN